MTYKFKAATDNIHVSSSAVNTEAKGRQSKPSASTDNTQPYMQTLSKPSMNTLTTGVIVSEKSRQHAALVKVLLSRLEKAGLVRRYKVVSKDKSVVKEYQIVFDPKYWEESLDLKVLS